MSEIQKKFDDLKFEKTKLDHENRELKRTNQDDSER